MISKFDAEFISRMEPLLELYTQAERPDQPRYCFDERPCVLHANKVEDLPMQAGQPQRQDYSYERRGTACALVAVEFAKGYRMVEVAARRTRREYTAFMQKLSARHPEAQIIHVVQDNLNTHTTASFYACLPPAEALALSKRFCFHHTPKKASWLNMAEIEIAALARACLHQRIDSLERLNQVVQAQVDYRNLHQIKIDWQFDVHRARIKLKRRYPDYTAKD